MSQVGPSYGSLKFQPPNLIIPAQISRNAKFQLFISFPRENFKTRCKKWIPRSKMKQDAEYRAVYTLFGKVMLLVYRYKRII